MPTKLLHEVLTRDALIDIFRKSMVQRRLFFLNYMLVHTDTKIPDMMSIKQIRSIVEYFI